MNDDEKELVKLGLFYIAHVLCGAIFGAGIIGFFGLVIGGMIGHFIGQKAITNLMLGK